MVSGDAQVAVERGLDARCEEQRSTRLAAHALGRPVQKISGALDHLPSRMGEQVEGVLHPTSALERRRVDGYPERLRQLLPVKLPRRPGQLHRALEQPPVHVVRDEPLAKRRKCPLRERGLSSAEAAEDHLPTQIDDGELDRLRVRGPEVALQENHHREQRRGHRVLASAGVAVHRLELRLQPIVKQLVPVTTKETEELPRPMQPLEEKLLLPRGLSLRVPTLHPHRHLRRERRLARSAEDHGRMGPVDPRRGSDRNHGVSQLIGVLGHQTAHRDRDRKCRGDCDTTCNASWPGSPRGVGLRAGEGAGPLDAAVAIGTVP